MVRLLQVAALAAAAHAFVPLQRLARPVQTSKPWALWASDGDDEAPKIVAEEAEDSGPEPGEEGYEAPKIAVPAPKPAPPKPAEPEAPDFFGMFSKAVAGAVAALDANARDYNAGFTHYGRLSHESYAYQRALEKAHDYLTFAIACALGLGTCGLPAGGRLQFTFLPKIEGDVISVQLRMPVGTSVEETRIHQERIVEEAQALMKEPRVNVNLVGDDIHQFSAAHVSVAIATDEGLYPATVYNADSKSPAEIAAATAELADKAQTGKLAKEDISGGSFTVSNLGMYGITQFTAIVNPPMGAILALGKATQQVVVEDGEQRIATVLNATLSCDHRVIDGAVGAQYLVVLDEVIGAL